MSPSKPRCLVFLPFLFILMLSTAASALAADRAWTVVASLGAVVVTAGDDGRTALDARAGTQLAPPFSVRTGHDGQFVVARGKDVLTIGPGAQVDVPVPEQDGQGIVTRIRQAFGSVLYQVEHKLRESFEAHTPYLVSVVKGTTFNILVTADASTVALIEGLLHVYTPDGKYESFIEAGQVAVKKAAGGGIRIEDQRSLSRPVAGPVRIGREDGLSASASDNPVSAVERLVTPLVDGLSNDSGARVSTLDVDIGGADLPGGIGIGDSSVRLGDASVAIGDEGVLAVGIGESSVAVGGISVGGTALTPEIEVGALSADVGGVSLAVGGDLGIGLDIGDSSVALGGASIGGTALTPSLDVGEVSANLGGIDLDLGSDLNLDLGDTSLNLGGVALGETALTPEIGLGDTSLNLGTSGIGLSTGLDVGVIDTIALDVGIDLPPVTETVTGTVGAVTDVVGGTTSTVINTITGGLKLF